MLSRNKRTDAARLSVLLMVVCGGVLNAAQVYRTDMEAHYGPSGPTGWEINSMDSISYDDHAREVERITHALDTRTPLTFKLTTRRTYAYQGDFPMYSEYITSNWDSPVWDTASGQKIDRTFDGNDRLISAEYYTLVADPPGFIWQPTIEVRHIRLANGMPDSIKVVGYKESTGRFESPLRLTTFTYGNGDTVWTVKKDFEYITTAGRNEYVGTTKMTRDFEGGLLVADSLFTWDDTLAPNPAYVKASLNAYTYTGDNLTKHEYKVWNGSYYANTLLWEYQWDGENQTVETHSVFDPTAGTGTPPQGAYEGVYQKQMAYNADGFLTTRYTKRYDGTVTEDSLLETWIYDSHNNQEEYELKTWDESLSPAAYANTSKAVLSWVQLETSVRQVAAATPKPSMSIATSASNRQFVLKGNISQATVALYDLAGRRVMGFSVGKGVQTAQFALDRKVSHGRYILKVTSKNARELATLPLLLM